MPTSHDSEKKSKCCGARKLCKHIACEREVRMKWCWEHQPKYNLPSPYKRNAQLAEFRRIMSGVDNIAINKVK